MSLSCIAYDCYEFALQFIIEPLITTSPGTSKLLWISVTELFTLIQELRCTLGNSNRAITMYLNSSLLVILVPTIYG